MHRLLIFLALLLIWVVFSGLFDAFHLTLGVLSCAFVTFISHKFIFDDRTATFRIRIRQIWRLAKYLLWLFGQVVVSNIHLLRVTLLPGGLKQLHPAIIRIKTPLKSDFEKFMLANSITLTPGTTTVRIEGQYLYIHAITKITADGLDGEMDRRIAHIFAPEESDEGNDKA